MYGVLVMKISPATTKNFAIKTSAGFSLVTVHEDINCCTVESVFTDDEQTITIQGTDTAAIKAAARNCIGRTFTTLKALRESVSVKVTRRTDLDC